MTIKPINPAPPFAIWERGVRVIDAQDSTVSGNPTS
jgi:hypothetical protein